LKLHGEKRSAAARGLYAPGNLDGGKFIAIASRQERVIVEKKGGRAGRSSDGKQRGNGS